LRARNQPTPTRTHAPATAPIAMPTLAPVDREEGAAAVAVEEDEGADVPPVAFPLWAEVVAAAEAVDVNVGVLEVAELDVVVLVVVSLDT